tara:strand:- start:50 stop:793 length:744 start_codon:yes stop_codon:yes gene_type:complete
MSAGALSSFVNYARAIPKAGKFKDFLPLVKSSATGGLLSGGLTTLFTGNPLAGLAVGATDTLGSAVLATGIGALGGKTGTRKLFGKDVNFRGGRKYTFSETDDLNPLLKQLQTTPNTGVTAGMKDDAMKNIASYVKSKEYYSPSGPQLAGMYAGSIAAPFAIEPLFMPRSQNYITNSQSMQTYGMNQNINSAGRPTNNEGTVPTNSMGTQVMAGQSMNLAPGTLYQLPYSPLSNLSTAFAAQSENVM